MGIAGSDFPPFGGFSSWEQWAFLAAIYSSFVAGGLIPLSIYLRKKIKSMRDLKKTKHDENVKEIATEVSNALENKLDEKIQQQSQAIESVTNTMEKLSQKLDHQDKQNKAILSTVRRLTSDFHTYKEKQVEVNAQVNYIDGIFRNLITFNGNGNSNGNNGNDPKPN